MRLGLSGGAPGVGKSSAVHLLLEEVYRRGQGVLVQWVEVESLWRHQPWQVNDRTTQLRDDNLRAVLAHAQRADVDAVVVAWVFATAEQYELVRALAPADIDFTTVQLTANQPLWRQRFGSESRRRPIEDIDVQRWANHVGVDSDHVIATDGLNGLAVGRKRHPRPTVTVYRSLARASGQHRQEAFQRRLNFDPSATSIQGQYSGAVDKAPVCVWGGDQAVAADGTSSVILCW